MRHRRAGIKISRSSSHRDAMFRNMVTSLLKHEKIKTTDTKAKEVRRWADRIITLAKRGDLHARRQAMAIVREKDIVHKLFETAAQRFGEIKGGYTRIIKAGRRPGDAAPVSIIELVSKSDPGTKAPKGKESFKKKEKKTEQQAESSATKEQSAETGEGTTTPADRVEADQAAVSTDSEAESGEAKPD